ncbi:kinase-like domain-containing protein [Xylaria digitata]|nr:kinase-like domain-containing protein [Xylaria digitata]
MATDTSDSSSYQPHISRNDEVKDSGPHQQPEPVYKKPYYELDWLNAAEVMEQYRPGGLHPVDIFDKLDGRFEVRHKLGSGGHATVWLCYEMNLKKWRAVKINEASRSHDDSPELKLLELLEKRGDSLELLAENHVIMPLEVFWIEGPNGRHLCTVLPVLGPTLDDWRCISLGTDAGRINNVLYQVTKGVDFLHSRGICHGDLRSLNILMKLKDNGLDHLEPDDLFKQLTYPERYEVFTTEGERSPHAPKWIIDTLLWEELEDYVSDEVAIVDFGEAFQECSPPKSVGIPKLYAAPEIVYGGLPFGKGVDIWSLAYTIMEIRTDKLPEYSVNAPLRRMERFAGPIPAPYRLAALEELYRDEMHRGETRGDSCVREITAYRKLRFRR